MGLRGPKARSVIDRFAEKIALADSGCIEWIAGTVAIGCVTWLLATDRIPPALVYLVQLFLSF